MNVLGFRRFVQLAVLCVTTLYLTGCKDTLKSLHERFGSGTYLIDAGVLALVTFGLSMIAYSMSGTLAVMVICCIMVYFVVDVGGPIAAFVVIITGAGTISLMQDLVKKAKEVEKARDEMREEHKRYNERERERRGGEPPILPK